MSAKLIRRIVEFFILVCFLGIALDLARTVLAALSGNFGTVGWHVSAAEPRTTELGGTGDIAWSDGTLTVTGQPLAHIIDLVGHFASVALLVLALLALRRVLLAFASGEVFTTANIEALRRIGYGLLAICAISVASVLILQPIILGAAEMPAGYVLHPSLSWNLDEVRNIWLEYDVPIFTFLLGGLALLVAEAFRNGMAYREDSESVV